METCNETDKHICQSQAAVYLLTSHASPYERSLLVSCPHGSRKPSATSDRHKVEPALDQSEAMCLSTFTSVIKIDYINIRSERHIKDLCSRRLILTLLRYIHHPTSLSNQLLFTKTPSPTTFITSTPTNQPNQQPHQQCLPPPAPSPSPAAAVTAAASAPKRPSAPAASSPPCNAPARSRPPRTRPLAPDARAVSPILQSPYNQPITTKHTHTDKMFKTSVPPASAPAAAPATKTTSPRATPAPAASDPPTLATARELRLAPARLRSLRQTSLPRLRLEKSDLLLLFSWVSVACLLWVWCLGKEMNGCYGVSG
jgi:pyruvate/2-oxoglutarate dehydrogenase complex dihydrolipoamide acyltransferase (E2) component